MGLVLYLELFWAGPVKKVTLCDDRPGGWEKKQVFIQRQHIQVCLHRSSAKAKVNVKSSTETQKLSFVGLNLCSSAFSQVSSPMPHTCRWSMVFWIMDSASGIVDKNSLC